MMINDRDHRVQYTWGGGRKFLPETLQFPPLPPNEKKQKNCHKYSSRRDITSQIAS